MIKQRYICLETKVATQHKVKYGRGRGAVWTPPDIHVISGMMIAEYYNVNFDECIRLRHLSDFNAYYLDKLENYIILEYRKENDYAEHLAKLKLEHLLKS